MALVRGYWRSWELAHWYWVQPPTLCPLTLSVQKILTCTQSCIYISLNTGDYMRRLCTQLYKITCIMKQSPLKKMEGENELLTHTGDWYSHETKQHQQQRTQIKWAASGTEQAWLSHQTNSRLTVEKACDYGWKFRICHEIHSNILQLDRMFREMQSNTHCVHIVQKHFEKSNYIHEECKTNKQ